jgi:hypothetical protein
MATFIPGITDYIPQVQPWQPDLGFYQEALQRKQSQYDAAYNKVSSLYGSLLNSPMLRDADIKRRDEFFKAIDNDIKRISTLDLSLEQNQDAAMELFRPFYEDENIVADMALTRKFNQQRQKGESYKNCTDQKKCNGMYWNGGMEYLNYWAEEFKSSSDEEALKFRSPEYVPAFNVSKELIDMAFKNKLTITSVNNRGGFLVTESNGRQSYLPLTDIFKTYMKDNAGVMKYFQAQGYLSRKRYADENAYKFQGDKNLAEQEYISKILAENKKGIDERNKKAEDNNQYIQAKAGAITNDIQKNGTTANSDLVKELEALKTEMQQSQVVVDQTKAAKDLYNGIENISGDINELRNRADAIMGNALFENDIRTSAKAYADATYTEKKQVNPYVLENVKFGHQMALSTTKFKQQLALNKIKFDQDKEKIYLNALSQVEVWKAKNGASSQFKVQGPENLNTFEELTTEENKSTSTGVGDVDARKETLKQFQEHYEKSSKANANLLERSIMYLQNEATRSDDRGRAAKLELKKILGNNYDIKSNTFKDSKGMSVSGIQSFMNPNAIDKSANTALSVLKGNPLYKSFYDKTISPIETQVRDEKEVQNTYLNNFRTSNNNIRNWAKSSASFDEDERKDFDFLFNNNGLLKSREKYIQEYNAKFNSDDGDDAYDDAFEKYESVYKNGALGGTGGPKIVVTSAGLPGAPDFAVGTTGKTGTGGKAEFSGLFSGSTSSLGIISFKRNAENAGRAKAVFGNDITKKDYEDLDDDEDAFNIFKAISNDLQKGGFKPRDKHIPTGQVYYRGVGANDPNLVAVTIKPDADYLSKFLITKKNPSGILSQKQYEQALNGVTVFMDKDKANDNMFYNMSKQGRYEVIASGGGTIPINIPGTSDITIRKENGKNIARGFIYQNYVDDQGNLRTNELNASDITNFSSDLDTYIHGLKYALSTLQAQNEAVLKNHQKTQLIYDVNQLGNQQGQNFTNQVSNNFNLGQ